jgi:hypothetical protein
VRAKLHVTAGVRNYTTRSPVYNNFQPSIEGCGWAYDVLLKLGYRILHIAGNTDGIITIPGMWNWLKDLNRKVTQPWSPYMNPAGDLIGHTKGYGNLTIFTYSGAGHDVFYAKNTDISRLVRRFTQERPL